MTVQTLGRATVWLKNKKHSFVRFIENSDGIVIEFQNDKFQETSIKLTDKELVDMFNVKNFMEQ